MARELNYKIVDVVPQHCTLGISSITKQSSEWYTKEKETRIRLEFGTAFVTSVSISIQFEFLKKIIKRIKLM